MKTHERTFFVSGHMDLTSDEFEKHYVPLLDEAIADKAHVVVGDAPGADTMAQAYMASVRYGKRPGDGMVTVFHMLEVPRNCAATWFNLHGGFLTDKERDEAMTRASTDDIAWVRPHRSKKRSGTAMNLHRRDAQRRLERIKERSAWPEYWVDTDVLADSGERFVAVVDIDNVEAFAPHKVMRLPAEMVARLRAARRAVMDAQRVEFDIENEVRAECHAQERDNAQR